MNRYYYTDVSDPAAPAMLTLHLSKFLKKNKVTQNTPLIFLCIGSPTVPGDRLGPLTGSLISAASPFTVYGTLEHPVHALNLDSVYQEILQKFPDAIIIAIDAAIGKSRQCGLLAVRHSPLKPGLGLGKQLSCVGNIHIVGTFKNIYEPDSYELVRQYSLAIASGILALSL